MTTQNTFTKEQEDIITQELLAIQQVFGLGNWLMRRHPRDGQFAYQYYLQDNIIWQYQIFTITNPVEYDPKDLGRTSEYHEKFAHSMNELVIKMWDTHIGLKGLQFASQQLHKQFNVEYPCKDWVDILITTPEDDNKIIFWIHAPKTLAVDEDYPVEGDILRKIRVKITDISAEKLKDCVDFYNEYHQLDYDFNLSMWQKIHQFIDDNHINERLGLQNPPFSLELYKLEKPSVVDYQQLLQNS